MINNMPDIVFYPATIIWSVCYGALAGAFFRLQSVYENWLAINRLQLILWKKYPQRSYKKYINNIWANQIRGRPVELAEYTRNQIERANPQEPYPITRMIINTIFMLLAAPFMALRGLFEGPLYVYRRAVSMRQNQQAISR